MALRKYWTFDQVKDKILLDCDLLGQNFITTDEMAGYINQAIDQAEREVHTLYKDYFLKSEALNMERGQERFDLPKDMYADKIRRVVFSNDADIFEIPRVKSWNKFIEYQVNKRYPTNRLYEYFLVNNAPGKVQLLLTPPSQDVGCFLNVWYLRQANRVVGQNDLVDIPEAYNFIFAYVKNKIFMKEGDTAKMEMAANDEERERMRLRQDLSGRTPDDDNRIELDTTFYEEMS